MNAPPLFALSRLFTSKTLFILVSSYSILLALAYGGNFNYGEGKMKAAHALILPAAQTTTQPPAAGQDRVQPPGFVLILAGLAAIDDNLARGLTCAAVNPASCPAERQFYSLVLLQALAALGLLYFAFRLLSALRLSEETAFLALLLFVLTFRMGDLVTVTSGQIFEVTLALGHITFLVEAYTRQTASLAAVSGLLLAGSTLLNPIYATMLPFEVALLVWTALRYRTDAKLIGTTCVALVSMFLVAIAPWSVRNLMTFGDPWLTSEGELYTLASRVALGEIGEGEWALAFVRWLPAMSDDVAGLFISKSTLREFLLYPGTNAHVRTSVIVSDAAKLATGRSLYDTILLTRVIDEPGRHAMTSAVLLMRGVFSGLGLFGLLALVMAAPVARIHKAFGSGIPVLLMVLPILGLAVVQSVVTPNEAWRNLLMPLLSSYTIAYLVKSL